MITLSCNDGVLSAHDGLQGSAAGGAEKVLGLPGFARSPRDVRLRWQAGLGSCTLAIATACGPLLATVSTAQACVLLLFNARASVRFGEIVAATGSLM